MRLGRINRTSSYLIVVSTLCCLMLVFIPNVYVLPARQGYLDNPRSRSLVSGQGISRKRNENADKSILKEVNNMADLFPLPVNTKNVKRVNSLNAQLKRESLNANKEDWRTKLVDWRDAKKNDSNAKLINSRKVTYENSVNSGQGNSLKAKFEDSKAEENWITKQAGSLNVNWEDLNTYRIDSLKAKQQDTSTTRVDSLNAKEEDSTTTQEYSLNLEQLNSSIKNVYSLNAKPDYSTTKQVDSLVAKHEDSSIKQSDLLNVRQENSNASQVNFLKDKQEDSNTKRVGSLDTKEEESSTNHAGTRNAKHEEAGTKHGNRLSANQKDFKTKQLDSLKAWYQGLKTTPVDSLRARQEVWNMQPVYLFNTKQGNARDPLRAEQRDSMNAKTGYVTSSGISTRNTNKEGWVEITLGPGKIRSQLDLDITSERKEKSLTFHEETKLGDVLSVERTRTIPEGFDVTKKVELVEVLNLDRINVTSENTSFNFISQFHLTSSNMSDDNSTTGLLN